MQEYRRHLPHIHPGDAWLFITWRLAGPLPRQLESHSTEGRRFVARDRALDTALSLPRWLQDPQIAAVVAESLLAGEREYYDLFAWVVMPNHVHLLISPNLPVPRITRWLKGATARAANALLDRTGQKFWQDESYDRYARGPGERDRIADYIERNPVSAGLVSRPEDFRWSSAWSGSGLSHKETTRPLQVNH